jgi:predicted dinucleotide-binding enzyme
MKERKCSQPMRVGILGSGLMGAKLGTLFARAGHEVVFSYARHRAKLETLAREAGTNARAGTPGEAARLAVAHTSSGAEELARRVPGARVAGAFNTVPSEVLYGVFEGRGGTSCPDLVCYGDPAAKKVAVQLARDIGFNPVDAGPLRTARYAEPFALLVARLAYEGKGSPELAYRFVRPDGDRPA